MQRHKFPKRKWVESVLQVLRKIVISIEAQCPTFRKLCSSLPATSDTPRQPVCSHHHPSLPVTIITIIHYPLTSLSHLFTIMHPPTEPPASTHPHTSIRPTLVINHLLTTIHPFAVTHSSTHHNPPIHSPASTHPLTSIHSSTHQHPPIH